MHAFPSIQIHTHKIFKKMYLPQLQTQHQPRFQRSRFNSTKSDKINTNAIDTEHHSQFWEVSAVTTITVVLILIFILNIINVFHYYYYITPG